MVQLDFVWPGGRESANRKREPASLPAPQCRRFRRRLLPHRARRRLRSAASHRLGSNRQGRELRHGVRSVTGAGCLSAPTRGSIRPAFPASAASSASLPEGIFRVAFGRFVDREVPGRFRPGKARSCIHGLPPARRTVRSAFGRSSQVRFVRQFQTDDANANASSQSPSTRSIRSTDPLRPRQFPKGTNLRLMSRK